MLPSSMAVGASEPARSTRNWANCFTLVIYLESSVCIDNLDTTGILQQEMFRILIAK